MRLFGVDHPNIPYPAAQNTHRYEDAHRELYGVLTDGLDKQAIIEELGKGLGRPINPSAQDFHVGFQMHRVPPTVTE